MTSNENEEEEEGILPDVRVKIDRLFGLGKIIFGDLISNSEVEEADGPQ